MDLLWVDAAPEPVGGREAARLGNCRTGVALVPELRRDADLREQ
ncbi:MAG: hypothetical protein AVDCRST_MAG19-4968 [uncultured Thermomicrobiales bacterium]|uniref:Uncharacterized protein n=1 Tax=uncultured Thermomicrobiales bacterium TaxID=1645740 RepID=A0A6J4VSZ3_9BACT|nr:MAG: hypothetical protein AVDCRST_MAG19-4968 [uncultured Thermomicrobiales bacterium]